MDLCVCGYELSWQCCVLARFPDLQVDAHGAGSPGVDHPTKLVIVAFADQMRANGYAVESILTTLERAGLKIAA